VSGTQSGTFICDPSPDHPGWHVWDVTDPAIFQRAAMGAMLVRTEDDGRHCRLRMEPGRAHANLIGTVHGGVTLSLIDIALFASVRFLLGGDAQGAMTLDLSTQFIGGGQIGQPLDAITEVLRETGRLAFMRGKVEQDGQLIAAYSATIRKPSQRT